MPAIFVGHGNPMNAIEDNRFSKVWGQIGEKIPAPSAIVVFSAHWMTKGRYTTAVADPKMIYDFYGFPEELYQVQYPAMGDHNLAQEITKICPTIKLDTERGLDHGAWSVLVRMFPEANIPVLQISLNSDESSEQEMETMRSLRELRERGVLFLGSGNIVHNLRMARLTGNPYNWAIDFDKKVRERLDEGDYLSLARYEGLGKVAKMAVPTDEHYRPMLAILGLAYEDEHPDYFCEDFDASSISMRSFVMKK